MIHCKLHGRLGNNMFAIANALSVSKKLQTQLTIDQTTLAGHRGERLVDLSMFGYKFNQINDNDLTEVYNEKSIEYSPIPLQDNIPLSGVFGSWKYFEDIRNELCNEYFTPSAEITDSLKKYQVSDNSLGIVVRRGDFLMLQQNHCVLSIEYYQEAINKHFQNNIDSIYVFSDDIEWCKSVFGDDVIYVTDTIGTQLFLMTKMKHLILANSTFAWWGAYLNRNNGIIVIPDPWLGPAYDHENTNDIYHPNWVRQYHTRVIHDYIMNKEFFN